LQYLLSSYNFQIELLAALFSECKNSSQDVWNELCNTSNSTYIMAFLLIAALIKLMLMCVVYGTRLPAGMFIPSLAGNLPMLVTRHSVPCLPALCP
jgi:H+/Cl- antiporter ClcA